ncbi:variant erythrocyte surface antigen-1 family protein [Babesia caballi]|uniref:Variant erythrocyte surface antigen-1 family protein n=1 Tax=Babesia caballi TaxID=5871 RepID=A0AAV4LQX2_BABCB|nr:variant erythrocyte surface antigen-1 family protein [Babesia caballi]
MLPLDSPLSAPVNPSFDSPSNLKEAIDWILRVTGKDGDGQDKSNDLARAITGLPGFTQAMKAAAKKLKDSGGDGVIQTMGKLKIPDTLGPIIKQLAEGLATFIGYQGGTIKHSSTGLGLPNDPRERLGDAVLGFLEGFIKTFETFKGRSTVELQGVTSDEIKEHIGNGLTTFESAVEKMVSLREKGGNQIQQVVEKLKEFNKLKQQSSSLNQLAKNFKTYLENVLDQVKTNQKVTEAKSKSQIQDLDTRVANVKDALVALVEAIGKQGEKPMDFISQGPNGLKDEIDAINYSTSGVLKKFHEALDQKKLPGKDYPVAKTLLTATYNATVNCLSQLQKGYKSYYQGVNSDQVNNPTCAKIFLSCIPLIISNLQHLYWTCKQGGWSTQHLNGTGQKGADLKNFMDLMAFSAHWLNGGKNGDNVRNVMNTSFKDLAAATASTYAAFLKNLKDKAGEYVKNPTNNPLSALFYCSKAYFQGCQAKLTQTTPPSSIREMLYWLSGLQFAQGYSELENLIENVVTREGLDVAISGSIISNEKLTSDQVTEYIVTTCLHAQTVFSTIQAPRISNHPDEPWLHSLYSNSEFNFTYPSSGSSLLYKVADYVYALQFQFHFLYKQCEFDYENGCGWFYCKFGSTVVPNDDTTVPSSFCGSVEVASGTHRGDKCGIQTLNPSPLQAFLTDKLKGFRRDTADHYSHLAECSGSMCHVPMGFKPENFRDLSTGGHLMIALNFFCGKPNTPLPKLCHTLSCVTKRTPRTLSDVFGFTFHLTGQMFNKEKNANRDPNSYLPSILDSLILKLKNFKPNLLYESLTENAKTIGSALFGFSWHCHWKENALTKSRTGATHYCKDHTANKVCDLMSLYDSECPNSTCGKYLEPLGVSSGATFADKYAFTYLSWALYLTDDIYESFQGFLDRFNSLTCKGCRNDSKCTSHASGDHASQCKCPSIVQCADALTVLYEYGFHFHNAFWLKGWKWEANKRWEKNQPNKRTCETFASQLQSVISGEPLSNLLTSIDAFLFLFRYYFLGNLSAFWAIYICLILYTFFFLLDTLHLHSHLKLTSTHTVPPLSLLTSGNPLPVTKLTYITQ